MIRVKQLIGRLRLLFLNLGLPKCRQRLRETGLRLRRRMANTERSQIMRLLPRLLLLLLFIAVVIKMMMDSRTDPALQQVNKQPTIATETESRVQAERSQPPTWQSVAAEQLPQRQPPAKPIGRQLSHKPLDAETQQKLQQRLDAGNRAMRQQFGTLDSENETHGR